MHSNQRSPLYWTMPWSSLETEYLTRHPTGPVDDPRYSSLILKKCPQPSETTLWSILGELVDSLYAGMQVPALPQAGVHH
jgi:hypothetical protein